ncbi:AAA family ATPase [Novosphingobium sp. KN65.2]|uniref:GumC family protein n=1 Tax=Novosphingobium sp. KN65.2 TaxID=1478134 RepID=UPI0005E0B3D5|nr:AAA family ATPase [Novosphingobium sp. KN65.2]CDO37117.1 putative Capsular exopolysaccharide family protein [Novosphingobium sp. KN65.2]
MNLPAIYEPETGLPSLMPGGAGHFRSRDEQISVRYLLSLLRRRQPVMVMTLILCLGLAVVWTSALPRIFRSWADVVMITGSTDVVPNEDAQTRDAPTRAEEVETQIQLIRSREMAGQVLDATGLLHDRLFRRDVEMPRTALDNILASVGFGAIRQSDRATGDEVQFRQRAVNYLSKRLDVTRVGNSFNLRIAFEDAEASRAAAIANGYARLFTTDDARERAQTNATAARVLKSKVDALRVQANHDFADVQAYRNRHQLLSSQATGLTEQELSTYNQQIVNAEAEAAQDAEALASARAQLRSGGPEGVGFGAGSPVVATLRSQRAQLVIRERDLSQRYFDNNPDLVTVRQQIADLDRQISGEVSRTLRGLETKAMASAQRLASLRRSRGGTQSQLQTGNSALVELADLEKKADASKTLYESYLRRYNAVVAGSGSEQPSARLISAANVPVLPVSPNLLLNLALALVVGVLSGAMLAILSELSYGGLTTLGDVETRIGLPGWGFVPAIRSIEPHANTPMDTLREYPEGPFSEALRNIIVSVRHSVSGSGKVLAITSAIPGEGKSTLAACIGRALAMANERVVVIDCDVIRSQLSKRFCAPEGEPGLYEALHDESLDIAQYEDACSPLRIVPITRAFPQGERLTERGRLDRVVARLREEFDVVILDCPPILPIAETRAIVAQADSVLLVVRWRMTVDRIVKAAIRQLPGRTLKQCGVVLNQVDMKKQVRFGGEDVASFYAHYKGYYR